MNPILLYHSNTFQLQETTYQLVLRGILLSKEDIEELQKTLHYICQKRHWIETNTNILDFILPPFLFSTYISQNNYLNNLKNIVIAYYEVRSRFHRFTSDNTVLSSMELMYERKSGVLDVYYIKDVIEEVHKRGKLYE